MIFNFFQKVQKCEISEEYNAKRGSGPSKTFDFRTDFSLTFDVFSALTPRHNFSRVKVPVDAHKSAPGRGFPPAPRACWDSKTVLGVPFPCSCPFLLGFLLDVLLVGDHLASELGTRGRRKLIQKIHIFLNLVS